MESAPLETLIEKVKIITQGRQAVLLVKLIDMLFEREHRAAALRGETERQPCGYQAQRPGLRIAGRAGESAPERP